MCRGKVDCLGAIASIHSLVTIGFVFSCLIIVILECADSAELPNAKGVSMTEYFVAVKRGKRGEVSSNWMDDLETISGVNVKEKSSSDRVSVFATPEGVENLRRALGEFCHIEPVIIHQPRSK